MIYKRRRVYWVKFMANGVMHYRSLQTHDKKTAMALAATIVTARMNAVGCDSVHALVDEIYGRSHKPKGTPLADAWSVYERTATAIGANTISERTLHERRRRLANFIAWAERCRPECPTIESVDGPCAAAYAAYLVGHGTKAKTRKNELSELGTVWRILSKAISGLTNPFAGVAPSRCDDSGTGKPFTDEDVQKVLAAADVVGREWPLVCRVGLWTGLRYRDCANLSWASVDMKERVIRLVPAKTARHKIAVAIPIAKPLYDALAKVKRDPTGLVAPFHAAHYAYHNASKSPTRFSLVLREAGLLGEGYTFHSFRHTFRTMLGRAGVSTDVAMRLCGHTTAAMSAHYDHAEHLGELREAINKAAAG